jgi:ABC-type branched-subunit amino acid transport system substrate-binding protein
LKSHINRRAATATLASLAFPSSTAFAGEPGVAPTTLTIGRVMPTGSPIFGPMARQHASGAEVCIASANAQGGIGGRRIVLRDRDDGYDAVRARSQTRALIEEDNVLALLGAVGTPTLPPIMELAQRFGVPLVGASSVGNEARLPPRKFVFPVRISALGEASAIVKHQATIGTRRFVVVSSKEAYGPAGGEAFASALRAAGFGGQEVAFGAADDPRQVARRLFDARPDVILLSVVPRPYGAVAREFKALGGSARTFGLSVIRIEDLSAALGSLAEGIALSQVLPYPMSQSSALAVDFRRALATHAPAAEPSYHALEGYLEARVLLEAIKRAGSQPSRTSIVNALESLSPHDFGGVLVHYGPTDRSGSTFSDLVMLGANGSTVR